MKATRHQIERSHLSFLEEELEIAHETVNDLETQLAVSEREVDQLHQDAFATRCLVFDLLDRLDLLSAFASRRLA